MKNAEVAGASGLARFTRYFFKCPPSKHLFFIMLVAALLFPIAGSDIFSKTGFFIFLIVPALLTSVFSWRVVQNLGGNFKDDHAYFLSTITMFSIAALLAVTSLIENFYIFKIWNTVEILFVGLAAIFMLHLLVYAAVGLLSIYRAVVPASLYLIFSALTLYSFRTVTPRIFGRFAILLFVSFLIVWLFVNLSNRPFKRTLGISTFDLISLAIAEYVNPEQVNRNPFKSLGKQISVPFQALKFVTKKSSYAIAVPWLHPGPIESIGGKLPRLLNSSLRNNFSNSLFFHTYVDHTLNPTSLEDVTRKISSLMRNINNFKNSCSRTTKFIPIKYNGATVLAQKFGKNYLFISSFAPKVTEDIIPNVGFSLLEKFSNNAIFVDAHNSFISGEEETEAIGFGDIRIKNLHTAITIAKQKVDREKQYPFKVKVLSSEKRFLDYGVNEISIIAFEIKDQRAAIVILDTNNIVPAFRSNIIKKLNSLGFKVAEVITTDAHLGDFVVKMYGHTGKLGAEVLESEIINLSKKAMHDLENANVSYLHAEIETKVFGEKTFHQLIATAHSLIPFAKFLGVSLFITFLFAAYVVLQLQI